MNSGKDLTAIMVAHGLPYVAQAAVSNHMDFMRKVQRALEIEGPKFINILQPCHRGWRCEPENSIELARMAVATNWWPIFEVDHGKWKVNHKPKEPIPVSEWFKLQGRFRHLTKTDPEEIIQWHQDRVDRKWQELLAKEASSQ